MKIITTTSQKGGVGKTTLAVFTALALQATGKRVLIVDLDHNNNSTDFFLRAADPEAIELSNIYHVLSGKKKLTEAIWNAGEIDIIPSTPTMSRIGVELANTDGTFLRFGTQLKKTDYDYVILDTHNGINLGMTIALSVCDLVLCPVSTSRWTVQGYLMITQEVQKVEDMIGKAPVIRAVPSMVSPTEAEAIQAATVWTATKSAIYKDPVFRNAVNAGRRVTAGAKGERYFADLVQEIDFILGGIA